MISTNDKLDWTASIPSGWSLDRLGKFAEIIVSSVDKKFIEDETPVRLCNYVDVYKNNAITNSIDFMEATATDHEIGKFSLSVGDVIATKDSENPMDIAVPSLVKEKLPGVLCGYHLAIVRADGRRLYGPFVAWLHSSRSIGRHYEQHATGITRWAIGMRDFKTCVVPIPPLTEQQRIADYLDASCEAIDEAIKTKQKQLDTLDVLRKSLITSAVVRGLNHSCQMHSTNSEWLREVPTHWSLVSLKRVAETQTGVTLGKVYEGEVIVRPYLRAANVQDGYLDLEKITTIELPKESVARYELRDGDVLMTEGGDLDKLGRGFLWEGQIKGCLHQNHVFAIRTNSRKLLPEFLSYVTTSQFGRDYFEATGKRTTNLASTNSTKVGQLPVPLPPLREQREIVSYLNKRLQQTKLVEQTISQQINTLRNYRKSLIHECVTGKRRISEDLIARVRRHV